MWKCKHCKMDFDFATTSKKANHSRWCSDNPKNAEYTEANRQNAISVANNKYGPTTAFVVICETCGIEFTVEERAKLFDETKKYYCSRSCANSVGGTAKRDKLIENGSATYRTIYLTKHDACCVVCGFDKIVEIHHIDENHDNNNIENLVALCPNHHQMYHSRYRDEIQPYITKWLTKRL